jgi:hypothetical protein
MKKCTICKIEKDLDEFFKNPKTKDNRQSACKNCETSEKKKRLRQRKVELVANCGGCCSLCGYSRSINALEFHHLIPKEKSYEISDGIKNGLSLQQLMLEVSKCILVCANCHREIEEE